MSIKKAILTGGGRATRLHPITTTINKHLLPLLNKPMIFYAIEKMVNIGIEEIFINVNPGDKELERYVGDGGHWGIRIRFFEQTGGPQGIAHVVKEAQKFIGNDPFVFYLSDNIILGELDKLKQKFEQSKADCLLAFARVSDARAFGVPYFDENGQLIDIVEKPKNPPNNLAVTGIYFYGPKVFYEAFDNIKKSARGEYEISSIHSYFLKNNYKVNYEEITGWWKDTGKPIDLLIANRLLLDNHTADKFKIKIFDLGQTKITGRVHIATGVRLVGRVEIKGPVIISENCYLENCVIGPYVTLNSNVSIKNAHIKESIILDNTKIEAKLNIHKTIIGKNVEIIDKEQEFKSLLIGDKTKMEL